MFRFISSLIIVLLAACSDLSDNVERKDVYVSTYSPIDSGVVLIKDGRVLTGSGEELEGADILIKNNVFEQISDSIDVPEDARVINAEGKWITPGIIDIHSHMGVYSSPSLRSNSDGNEATSPVTP
ncbi:MAG TPA: amidohydrolase, partial [SAR86 cluster bacterium]|nr:amidohydrolase [SAR86 cluster bacterium]